MQQIDYSSEAEQFPRSQAKYYTDKQVGFAAFLGGPMAGCHYLARNYAFLGQPDKASTVRWRGFLSTIVLAGIVIYLPENTPDIILPAVYSGILWVLNDDLMRPHAQAMRENPKLRGNTWKLAGVSLFYCAVLLGMIIVEGLLLDVAGLLPPEMSMFHNVPADTMPAGNTSNF